MTTEPQGTSGGFCRRWEKEEVLGRALPQVLADVLQESQGLPGQGQGVWAESLGQPRGPPRGPR